MQAAVFHGPKDIRVERVPDPTLQEPGDALVHITHACICGSDLWPYRGLEPKAPETRIGHEWMGIVEDVGKDVQTVKKGDRVISPFTFSDGTCEFCEKGLQTSCIHGGIWGYRGSPGGQAEAICAPLADGTLVVVPPSVEGDEDLLKAILPLTDVMGTGHHAAVCAGVKAGGTAVVIGDGAVGLCGVIASKRLGAERIFILGHQPDRLQLAQEFGATDIISARGDEAIKEIQEKTKGGAESILECVGSVESMNMAIKMARPGGRVGIVGAPHFEKMIDLNTVFFENITICGGMAPVRKYLPELLKDVMAGKFNPAPVFNKTVPISGIPDGYAAMDQRQAIKVMVHNI